MNFMMGLLNKFRYILGLTALIVILILVQVNMSGQLRDPDIWLHLKAGENILKTQTVPQVDIFSIAVSGKPWIDHSWLVQVIFYLIFNAGGPDALIALSAFIVTLAFLLLFFTYFRKKQDLTFIIAMLFLTAAAAHMRFNIRPENFSVLFFSIFLLVLTRLKESKFIFILPFIEMFWVNCHGFFVLGPMLLGIFIIGEFLKRSTFLPAEWSTVGLFSNKALRNLILVFFLSCLATLVNPYGLKGALYPLGIMTASATNLSIFYKYIQELMPVWQAHSDLGMDVSMYCAFALVSFATFLVNYKKINISHLIIWIILLVLSAKINRNIMYFSFVAFIVSTDNLLRKFDFNKLDFSRRSRKLIYLASIIVTASIIFSGVKNINIRLDRHYYVFEEYQTKSALLGFAKNEYPQKGAEFILKNNLPPNIYNLFDYGHFLIYKLYPKYKVFIDGRTELYGKDFFDDYLKTREANDQTIKTQFKKYNINTVILFGRDIYELAAYFYKNPDWALVFFSDESVIFIRKTPQNAIFVKTLKVNLENWKSPEPELEKIGLKNVFPGPYVRRAWQLYYFGLYKQAINEARAGLIISPNCFDFYSIIGLSELKDSSYDKAYENLRLAYIFAPNKKETLRGLGEYYMAKKSYNEAGKIYKRIIRINPSSSEGHYHLGLCYMKMNQYKLAIDYLNKAIKINPNSEKFYITLGGLLIKTGDFKSAADVYKKALRKKLNYRYFYKELSKLYWEKLSKITPKTALTPKTAV